MGDTRGNKTRFLKISLAMLLKIYFWPISIYTWECVQLEMIQQPAPRGPQRHNSLTACYDCTLIYTVTDMSTPENLAVLAIFSDNLHFLMITYLVMQQSTFGSTWIQPCEAVQEVLLSHRVQIVQQSISMHFLNLFTTITCNVLFSYCLCNWCRSYIRHSITTDIMHNSPETWHCKYCLLNIENFL